MLNDFITSLLPVTNNRSKSRKGISGEKHSLIFSSIVALLMVSCGGDDPANRAPIFTSEKAATCPENQRYTGYTASTDEANVRFSISGGADARLLGLDTQGRINFIAVPDFETPADADGNNVYEVELTAENSKGASSTQVIKITISNTNEAPVFTTDNAITVDEMTQDTFVTLSATDPEGSTLNYQATGGADQAMFDVTGTGEVSFSQAPDFEIPADSDADNIYELQVEVADTEGATDQLLLRITITDLPFTVSALSARPGREPRSLKFSWEEIDVPPDFDHYTLLMRSDARDPFEIVADNLQGTEHLMELSLLDVNFLNDEYVIQARDSSNADITASNVLPLFGNLDSSDLIGYFKASNGETQDYFGTSVALSADGKVLAVSAQFEDSSGDDPEANTSLDSGAVYIFKRTHGAWRQSAILHAPNADPGDEFGTSIALSDSGTRLVVSAPFERSGATTINGDQADNSVDWTGAVYVFDSVDDHWTLDAYLKKSNINQNEFFGSAVSISGDGNTVAVAAPNNTSNALGINVSQTPATGPLYYGQTGAVYVFARQENGWVQQSFIKASSVTGSFGRSLALNESGNRLAVGATRDDSGSGGINGNQADTSVKSSGAVFVLDRQQGAWSHTAYIKAPLPIFSGAFGIRLDFDDSGDLLVVTEQKGKTADTSTNVQTTTGRIYAYGFDGSTWSLLSELRPRDRGVSDSWGLSIAVSGNGQRIAIGNPHEDGAGKGLAADPTDNSSDRSGAVVVFQNNNGLFEQIRYVKAPNTDALDYFGEVIALDFEGDVLAVSSRLEDSAATTINGDQKDNTSAYSGAVYLY